MKALKAKDLRGLNDAELVAKGEHLAEDLFKLKFQHGIRAIENTARLAGLKVDIARIKTVLSERKQAASN